MKAALTEIATKFLSLGPEARMEFITKLADSGTAPPMVANIPSTPPRFIED
jgi:hypothetical protein